MSRAATTATRSGACYLYGLHTPHTCAALLAKSTEGACAYALHDSRKQHCVPDTDPSTHLELDALTPA